jgi:transposase
MRKYSKYSDELILELVLKIVRGEQSIAQTSRLFGAPLTYVRRWVAMYKQHGADGLFKRESFYSAEFKLHVIEDRRENNLSLMATIVKYAIPSESTLLKWERIYAREGVAGILAPRQGRRIAEQMNTKKSKSPKPTISADSALLRELEYLRAENAYLKKLQALVEERIVLTSGKKRKPSKD